MGIAHIRQLNKVYTGKVLYQALSDIDFIIEEGEFLGIMGPSGSGKTTLLNLIGGFDQPTSGEIIINGKVPAKLNQEDLAQFRRNELGFVFQSFNLLPTLTVEENIILPLVLDNVSTLIIKQKVAEVAEELGISGILDKRTYEISGGQAQRVAIGRAIIHEPTLLLADEPTGNLDSKSSKGMMETFKALNKKGPSTILLVTHDPSAASYCDRVIFIKDGRLFSEIYNDGNRQAFFQKIINVLSLLGGNMNEFLTASL